MPSLFGDEIVLPPDEIQWITDQPDDVLDSVEEFNQRVQVESCLVERYVLTHPTHNKIVGRDLNRHMQNLSSDLYEELSMAIDETWGMDTEGWKQIDPFQTFVTAIARASNRVFLGSPLCRKPELVENSISFSSSVVPCALVIRKIPKHLRPIFVPFVTLGNRLYKRKLRNVIRPQVLERLSEMATAGHLSNKDTPVEPKHQDLITWTIEAGIKSGGARELDPEIVTQRIILLIFGSIHTTTVTAVKFFYDLISSPSQSESYISTLRHEISTTLGSDKTAHWDKLTASNLHKLDSAIRETARLTPLSGVMLSRVVAAPGGISTPESGSNIYLPEGSTVGIPCLPIHRNPAVYPDPDVYRPFRFAELRDTSDVNLNCSTTSNDFVFWSHGRHACPGRHFATFELKLLFAYILQKYDFEILSEKPPSMWIGPMIFPPMNRTVKVRRREKT